MCYGIDMLKETIDSDATATFSASNFAPYAENGLLTDAQAFCNYTAANREYLELTTPNSECLYNELMAVPGAANMSIYDRVWTWMFLDSGNLRFKHVGVEINSNSSGNFGGEGKFDLTWICHPYDCQSNTSSFFNDPDHALTMLSRWEKSLYTYGDAVADEMNVPTLTGSDAWLFPILSSELVKSLYESLMISLVGCLALLYLVTWSLTFTLIIGLSMVFVIALSILLHGTLFSPTVDLLDIVVLISFIGIIIDYPTHMAFHYVAANSDKEKRQWCSYPWNWFKDKPVVRSDGDDDEEDYDELETLSSGDSEMNARGRAESNAALWHEVVGDAEGESKHFKEFQYMRKSLFGPALTTICAAIPLLFADFQLISKAGEYVVIMCGCTYVFVAVLMPTLLRYVNE